MSDQQMVIDIAQMDAAVTDTAVTDPTPADPPQHPLLANARAHLASGQHGDIRALAAAVGQWWMCLKRC